MRVLRFVKKKSLWKIYNKMELPVFVISPLSLPHSPANTRESKNAWEMIFTEFFFLFFFLRKKKKIIGGSGTISPIKQNRRFYIAQGFLNNVTLTFLKSAIEYFWPARQRQNGQSVLLSVVDQTSVWWGFQTQTERSNNSTRFHLVQHSWSSIF